MERNIKDERNKFEKKSKHKYLNFAYAGFGTPMRFPGKDDQ